MAASRKRGEPFQDLAAKVVKAFAPGANVEVGKWVKGPDGRRDQDVRVRGTVNGRPCFVLIECKDQTYATKRRRVGIGAVDNLESKRWDVGADISLLASNSGFTKQALHKAARTGIGAIAVLKSGDPRAKARILQSIFLRRVTERYGPPKFRYFDEQNQLIVIPNWNYGCAEIHGEAIDPWLLDRALQVQTFNPFAPTPTKVDFRFAQTMTATHRDVQMRLSRIEIGFYWSTEWLRQTVELEAGTAIYNYLNPDMILAPGENSISIGGVNFDTAEACEPPPKEQFYRAQRIAKMQLCHITIGLPKPQVRTASAIERAVLPEDLAEVIADAARYIDGASEGS
jgi:hypothetical protein